MGSKGYQTTLEDYKKAEEFFKRLEERKWDCLIIKTDIKIDRQFEKYVNSKDIKIFSVSTYFDPKETTLFKKELIDKGYNKIAVLEERYYLFILDYFKKSYGTTTKLY